MHAHTYSVSLSLSLSVSVSLSVSLSVSNVASVNSAKVAFWFGQNINSKRYCGDLVEGTLFLIILSNYAQNYIIIIPPPPPPFWGIYALMLLQVIPSKVLVQQQHQH